MRKGRGRGIEVRRDGGGRKRRGGIGLDCLLLILG